MQNSKAYDCLIKQLNANGSEKMDGYYPEVMEEIYDWEREEVEDIIWDAFFNKNEIELAQFFPKLKKYDGIKALKESPYLLQIPSEASVEISKILYEATGDEGYLDIIKKILMHLRKRYHLFQFCHIVSLVSDYITFL